MMSSICGRIVLIAGALSLGCFAEPVSAQSWPFTVQYDAQVAQGMAEGSWGAVSTSYTSLFNQKEDLWARYEFAVLYDLFPNPTAQQNAEDYMLSADDSMWWADALMSSGGSYYAAAQADYDWGNEKASQGSGWYTAAANAWADAEIKWLDAMDCYDEAYDVDLFGPYGAYSSLSAADAVIPQWP